MPRLTAGPLVFVLLCLWLKSGWKRGVWRRRVKNYVLLQLKLEAKRTVTAAHRRAWRREKARVESAEKNKMDKIKKSNASASATARANIKARVVELLRERKRALARAL